MTSPDPLTTSPWKFERTLRDDKAGIAVQVYTREAPSRHPHDPPVVHRSFQVVSIDPQGQIRRHFYARVLVGEGGAVSMQPFPYDALRTLIAQVERDHVADRTHRESRLVSRKGPTP